MHHLNMLASNRKRWRLTQGDLAALLDISADAFGHYERGERTPPLAAALGLEIIFGRSPGELFHEMRFAVANAVLKQAADLSIVVEGEEGGANVQKRQLLTAINDRLARILPGV